MRNLWAACLLASTFAVPCSGAGDKVDPRKVVSRARKLEVVEVADGPRGPAIVAKNDYTRTIAAYSISGGGRCIVIDSSVAGAGEIPAGARVEIPLRVLESGRESADKSDRIEIEAVIFDDGTSDGDFLAINSMMGQRAGRAEQLRRFLELAKQTLDLLDTVLVAGVDVLFDKTKKLPDQLYGGARDTGAFDARDLTVGMTRTKQDLLRDLDRLRGARGRGTAPGAADAAASAELRKRLEALVARYEAHLRSLKISSGA
jgi:hypothetical protein